MEDALERVALMESGCNFSKDRGLPEAGRLTVFDMQEATERVAQMARKRTASGESARGKTARGRNAQGETVKWEPSSCPDWEALPGPALFRILQLATPPYRTRNSFSYFLVCKRWWEVAKQALQRFATVEDSNIEQGTLLLRGLAQFPNVASVTLHGSNISDFVLEAVGALCPKLVHLTLDQPDTVEERVMQRTTPDGLASAFDTLTGLRHLTFAIERARLPDSISCLQKLESLVIGKCMGPIPDGLGALSSLKRLHVNSKEIEEPDPAAIIALPASVSRLARLEELILDLEVAEDPLPGKLGSLTSLRKLSFSSEHRGVVLNESVTDLRSLEELKLDCKWLRSLPTNLRNLKKLRKLRLNGSCLSTMPPCLLGANEAGQTLGLENLLLKRFQAELTGGLSCLSSTLRTLNLSDFNHFLPYQIGSLSRLQSLGLWHCKAFQHFPDSFCDLVSLQELRMHHCDRVEALPRALTGCARLKLLEIYHCPALKTLPADLGDAPALERLDLEGLPSLQHLPPTLINAKRLRQLLVRDCPQVVLSPGLLELPSLDPISCDAVQKALNKNA